MPASSWPVTIPELDVVGGATTVTNTVFSVIAKMLLMSPPADSTSASDGVLTGPEATRERRPRWRRAESRGVVRVRPPATPDAHRLEIAGQTGEPACGGSPTRPGASDAPRRGMTVAEVPPNGTCPSPAAATPGRALRRRKPSSVNARGEASRPCSALVGG